MVMPWVRIDEHALNHVKILALSLGAFRLWVEGLAHCQKHLTDGAISQGRDARISLSVEIEGSRNSQPCVDGSACGNPPSEGWQVHDYLQWNDSRDHVRAEARRHAKAR